MHKKGVIYIVLLLLILHIVNAVNVDKEIEDNLETQDEVSVIVTLKDDLNFMKKSRFKSLNKKKLMIKKKQEKVYRNFCVRFKRKRKKIKLWMAYVSSLKIIWNKKKYGYRIDKTNNL